MGDGSAGAAKNFVGVSQVFNSLNDYRNNVQSLATELQAHESYDWTAEGQAAKPEKQQPEQEEYEEEEELARHEDINKFSESQAQQLKEADELNVSTESLTTSSCSTFSSGPSPGAVSNSDEQELSTPPESEKPSALELPPKANGEPAPESHPSQQQQQHASAAVEDLAMGLSSISLTNTNTTESQSILPCEVTASSALDKVLNELSEESSTELDTQSQARAAADKNMDTDILPAVSSCSNIQTKPNPQYVRCLSRRL